MRCLRGREQREPLIKYTAGLMMPSAGRRAFRNVAHVAFNKAGDEFLVTYQGFLPTVYSLRDHDPRLVCNDETYRNTCTMKSHCFGGYNDDLIIAGSDDYQIYVWNYDRNAVGPIDAMGSEGCVNYRKRFSDTGMRRSDLLVHCLMRFSRIYEKRQEPGDSLPGYLFSTSTRELQPPKYHNSSPDAADHLCFRC